MTAIFPNDRRQAIQYIQQDGDLDFASRIIGPRDVEAYGVESLAQRVLLRNRAIEVVGFRITPKNWLEAWISHRLDTLQREELIFYLSRLAREADRFEYLLVGRDEN